MNRKVSALLVALAVVLPVGGTVSMAQNTAYARASATQVSAATTATRTYKGSTVDTQWGPVQATITIKGKKIVDAGAVVSTHTARSTVIDSRALSVLRSEVLVSQSAKVNAVSGATMVSEAYIQSLQSAVAAAKLAHAL